MNRTYVLASRCLSRCSALPCWAVQKLAVAGDACAPACCAAPAADCCAPATCHPKLLGFCHRLHTCRPKTCSACALAACALCAPAPCARAQRPRLPRLRSSWLAPCARRADTGPKCCDTCARSAACWQGYGPTWRRSTAARRADRRSARRPLVLRALRPRRLALRWLARRASDGVRSGVRHLRRRLATRSSSPGCAVRGPAARSAAPLETCCPGGSAPRGWSVGPRAEGPGDPGPSGPEAPGSAGSGSTPAPGPHQVSLTPQGDGTFRPVRQPRWPM